MFEFLTSPAPEKLTESAMIFLTIAICFAAINIHY